MPPLSLPPGSSPNPHQLRRLHSTDSSTQTATENKGPFEKLSNFFDSINEKIIAFDKAALAFNRELFGGGDIRPKQKAPSQNGVNIGGIKNNLRQEQSPRLPRSPHATSERASTTQARSPSPEDTRADTSDRRDLNPPRRFVFTEIPADTRPQQTERPSTPASPTGNRARAYTQTSIGSSTVSPLAGLGLLPSDSFDSANTFRSS